MPTTFNGKMLSNEINATHRKKGLQMYFIVMRILEENVVFPERNSNQFCAHFTPLKKEYIYVILRWRHAQ